MVQLYLQKELQQLSAPGNKLLQKCKLKLLSAVIMLVACFGSQLAMAQVQVIVGTGTSSSTTASIFSTSTTTNKYSKNIAIYSAADIIAAGGMAGNITKIAWQKGGTGEYTFGDIQLTVWMKEVSFTQHATTPITFASEVTGATQVFTSTTQSFITGNGWNEILLQTPFTWNGTSNIEVFVEFYRPNTPTGNINWFYTTATNANASQVDSTVPTTASRNNNRPNIRIEILPNTPCTAPPTPGTASASVTTVCANTNFNLNLSGNSFGSGQMYQWETSPNGTTGWTAIGTAATSPLLTTTQGAGTHFYRAAVTCSGQTTFSTTVSVTSPALVSGTFTINKNIPASATNFITFTDAVNSLACGINGPVVFNVVAGSGPYTEQFEMTQVGGMSATNTITINGNGNTISADPVTGNKAVVRLNGADFVNINNLTIATTGTTTSSFGWGVHLMNGADNNTISNNTINIGSLSTGSSDAAGIVFANSVTTATTVGNTGNNNVISGNTISGGYRGIRLNGINTGVGNNQIINNIIRDYYNSGIEIDDANATLVEGNDVSRPNRVTVISTSEGITLSGTTQNSIISKNRVHNSHGGASSLTGSFYALYSTANDAPTGSENIFRNNLVYDINNTGISYGIYNTGSNGAFYYHNTVNLDNMANTGNVRGFYQTTTASNINFMNNVIRVVGGNTGNKHAIYFGTAASTITSDRNAFFVSGGAAGTSGIGFAGGNNQATIADWRTATTQDANSVMGDPVFTNIATGNFTPTNALLNNIGAPVVPAVTHDITGAVRSTTTPDPGAYEFTATIILPATPTITASGSTTFCQGGSVVLTASSSTPGVTYQWFNNATAITGATAATYTATTSGSYTVQVSIGAGNSTSAATVVTVNAKPATPTVSLTGNTLTASTTTGTYQWFSVAGTTLTPINGATSPTFTPTVNGSYTVVVTTAGCQSDPATAVTVTVTGISSMAPGMDVSVYPNPTAGKFAVNLVGFEKEATIQIINVTGQIIASENVAVTSNEMSKAFNLNGMAKGVYILKVTSGDNLTFRKVMVD